MTGDKDKSTDRLIWLAAGVVACMGLAWLIVEAPWSADDEFAAPDSAGQVMDTGAVADGSSIETPPGDLAEPEESAEPPAADPLHLARLALEAGMLVEPEQYSAWAIFGEVAASDPQNTEARDGLEQVAEVLLRRAESALEQGRYADAETIADTIRERLPSHAGASELAGRVAIAMRPPPPPVVAEEAEPEPEAVADIPVDPVPVLHAAFLEAMASNSVLTPPGASARDQVNEMLELDPDHELALAAREMLVTEMLDRSQQSIEALDTAAAQTWIDSAAPLVDDRSRIARAQDRLTRHLIEIESQKRLPASALNQIRYVPPEYPQTAISRDIEGWVDIEFVVSPEGETEQIAVFDASHSRYFRDEAVAAVDQWRFEPVIFMDQPISQRSFTRLAFVFE